MNTSQYMLLKGKTMAWKDVLPQRKRTRSMEEIQRTVPPDYTVPTSGKTELLDEINRIQKKIFCPACRCSKSRLAFVGDSGVCATCYIKGKRKKQPIKTR